jgi:acyl-CoA thioesterase FadM
LRRRLSARAVAWPGPEVPQPAALGSAEGAIMSRDRVKPWELGEGGMMSLSDTIHRFSGAGMQFLSSIGMTGAYMQENRRGFSTMSLDLNLVGGAKVGDRIDVRTSIAPLGNTSLRYVHRMRGVQLDLDTRRPTPCHRRSGKRSQGFCRKRRRIEKRGKT